MGQVLVQESSMLCRMLLLLVASVTVEVIIMCLYDYGNDAMLCGDVHVDVVALWPAMHR